MCVYVCVSMCMCMCVCIDIYIYIYIRSINKYFPKDTLENLWY